MKRGAWQKKDVIHLHDLVNSNRHTWPQIAKELGRPYKSCIEKYQSTVLPGDKAKVPPDWGNPHPDCDVLIVQLFNALKYSGMTWAQIAEKSGVPHSTMSRWFSSAANPGLGNLRAVLACVDLKMEINNVKS